MTPLVVRMMTVSDTTTWSVTYNCHSDECNIFIIQATVCKQMPIRTPRQSV
jgi:hypothetical protein